MVFVSPVLSSRSAGEARAERELILVDGLCPAIAELLPAARHELLALSEAGRPLQWVASALEERRRQGRPAHTLHLVAHGRSGGVLLGNRWIDAAALVAEASQLARWQVRCIALWSCRTGADPAFLALLAELTGASVQASSRPIGIAADGAAPIWSLDVTSARLASDQGRVALEAPFRAEALAAWRHSLPVASFTGLYKARLSGDPDGFFDEETSSVVITTTPVSTTAVEFTQSGVQFSGNNISGTISYQDSTGQTISFSGLASRPIKQNGVVKGFYVWLDASPRGGSALDQAYILSLDNAFFEADANVRSSSDRVDNALNGLLANGVSGVSITHPTAGENAQYLVFTLTNSAAEARSLGAVSLSFDTATASDLSASLVYEYSTNGTSWSATRPASIGAGQSLQVRVGSIINDRLIETDETLSLSVELSWSGGSATLRGTGTILDDDGGADTDRDSVTDANDLDDDNDGILDVVEQTLRGGEQLSISSIAFQYAQNTLGYDSFHNARQAYGTGDRNDPAFLFDGNPSTELRVHNDDVYEFDLKRLLEVGSSFTLSEGNGTNDAKVAVLGSLGSTDASGNDNNTSGGGQGWATIRARFDGIVIGGTARAVKTVADLEALFLANGSKPLISKDGNSVLFYAGASDRDQTFTSDIPISHFQIVGLAKHGGWADLRLERQINVALDTDGDGIFNHLDLDSDNDGISDLAESVAWNTSVTAMLNDSDRDGTFNSLGASFSANGVLNVLGDAGTTPVDSDRDGIADFLDLDSDADGIADTVELRATAGYQVNDGDVRDEDADGDGVIARFDSNDASGGIFGGSFTTPVNTDSSKEGVGSITRNGAITNANWIRGGADWQASPADFTCIKTLTTDANRKLDKKSDGYAKLKTSDNDVLVFDFGTTLLASTTIRIAAASNLDAATGVTRRFSVTAASDFSGTDVSGTSRTFDFTNANKQIAEDFQYTVGASGLRYLVFRPLTTSSGGSAELRLDYVSSSLTSTVPSQPDYLDQDSDADGLRDINESGRTLTGIDTLNGADGIDDSLGTSYQDPDGQLANNTGSNPLSTLKNNDADANEADYRSLNNGRFTVSNVRVNEGSPYAMFSIVRPSDTASNVRLQLTTAASGPGVATIGDNAANDVVRRIEYFDGSSWVLYSSGSSVSSLGSNVSVPGDRPLLVRVGLRNDNPAVYEGPEAFRLEVRQPTSPTDLVDPSGGFATIVDDGSGDVWLSGNNNFFPDLDEPLDDDRRLVSIDDLYINEGVGTQASPRYAVFTLLGNAGQTLTSLSLAGTKVGNSAAAATAWNGSGTLATNGTHDFLGQIQWDDNGSWKNYSSGSLTLDAFGTLSLRVAIYNDSLYERNESFQLTANYSDWESTSRSAVGTAYILDDGTGDAPIDPSTGEPDTAALDDDTPLFVSSPFVNEASTYAVFDVESLPGRVLTLQVAPSGSKPATTTGFTIQYSLDEGASWTAYTWNGSTGNRPTVPDSGEVLVRVNITNEQDTPYEGAETFTLTATPTSGTAGTGTATILDNGTGAIYKNDGSTDGTASKDDDRPLSINSFRVSESSPYAVFTVTGASGEKVALALSEGTAISGFDYSPSLQVYRGGSWVAFSPSDAETIPASGTLLVRTSLVNDTVYEGDETVSLTATYTTGGSKSASGTATITDDGSSTNTFLADNTSGSPSTGPANDDRGITVVGLKDVSEGSSAIFSISLTGNPSGTSVSLSLGKAGDGAGASDYSAIASATAYYYNGATRTNLTISNGSVNLPAGITSFYVSVPTIDDAVYEGPEAFTLEAGTYGKTGSDTSIILDDGSGKVYDDKGLNPSDPGNDDRGISVAGKPDVSEGSDAIFTVELTGNPSGTTVKLSLAAVGDTAAGSDYSGIGSGVTAYYYVGSVKTSLSINAATGEVTLPAGVSSFFVYVPTISDDVYEGPETFTLKAEAYGRQDSDTASIVDDGSGKVYDDQGVIDPDGLVDNDKPTISVSSVTVSETSPYAVLEVSLNRVSPFAVSFQPQLESVQATEAVGTPSRDGTEDYGPGLQYLDTTDSTGGPGGTWKAVSGPLTIAAGQTSLLLRAAINDDDPYEISETFRIKTGTTTGVINTAGAFGTVTIKDDGSSSNWFEDGNKSPFPTSSPSQANDDKKDITVSGSTFNEGSKYAIFTVANTYTLSGLPDRHVSLRVIDSSSQLVAGFTPAQPEILYSLDGGSSWQTYDSTSNRPLMPVGNPANEFQFLVAVNIVREADSPYEGAESFFLEATDDIDGDKATGTSTILDDGSGSLVQLRLNGQPDASNNQVNEDSVTPPDDDRRITVTGLDDVSEGSAAIFTVTLSGNPSGTSVSLSLGDLADSAEASDFSAIGSGVTAYYYDGSVQTALQISNGSVQLPAGVTTFYVKVPTINDADYEGAETFTLEATSYGKSGSDTATILDDGSGNVYDDKALADPTQTADDDRGITVVGLDDVSEGSNAVFTITLTGNPAGTTVNLGLGDAGDSAEAADYSALAGVTAYYYDGVTKTSLSISGGGDVNLPAGFTVFYVSVPTVDDSDFETSEDFTLSATAYGKQAADTATILDDGTGAVYDERGLNPGGLADDDRSITVSGLDDVSEGSNAVFSVTLQAASAASTEISLSLSNGGGSNDAAESGDYAGSFSDDGSDASKAAVYYYNGSNQQTFLPVVAGKITLPANVSSFYVRVPSVQDGVYEGKEDFKLTATITGGKSGSDTSTVVDDGSGRFYDDKGVVNPSRGPADDDRPTITVSSLTIDENSPTASNSNGFAVVDVLLSAAAEQPVEFTPFLTGLTASNPADFGPTLEFSLNSGSSWSAVTDPLSFAPGQQTIKLRTAIFDDNIFDPNEQFTVNTGKISSGTVKNPSGAVGTVTIRDNEIQSFGTLSVTTKSTGNEAGVLPNVFVFQRSNADLTNPLVVPFSLADSSAKLTTDFTSPTYSSSGTFNTTTYTGTITIQAGQSTAELTVPTVNNLTVDGTRSVVARLAPVSGYTITPAIANGFILDNDVVPTTPVVTLGNGTVVETNAPQNRSVSIALSLASVSTKDVTIKWATANATNADVSGRQGLLTPQLGIATGNSTLSAGTDYRTLSGQVTLKAGVRSAFISLPVVGDSLVENDELFYITITDVSVDGQSVGVGNGGRATAEIIIVDNDITNNVTLNYASSVTPIDLRGGTGNDSLIGSTVDDYIYGHEGNDIVEGLQGADVLTGNTGSDRFQYNDLLHSTRQSMDNIRDLTAGNSSLGDRILFAGAVAASRPTAIFNATRTSPIVGLDGVTGAIQTAFNDVNGDLAGDPDLGVGQAVIFSGIVGSQTYDYMVVNLGNAGFDPASDFMVEITGWNASKRFATGPLAVSDFFA
jgi:hypothetical protein